MTELKPRAARMTGRLQEALDPVALTVRDDSRRHANHAGRHGIKGDETHFTIAVVSTRFADMNRVARHRLVNELLKSEFDNGLHGLSLSLKTPDEQ